MAKVKGIGGLFFRSGDPSSLREWYSTHLGLSNSPKGHFFPWRHADDPDREGMTIWATFPKDTSYFGPTRPEFMVNYIVDDLDGILAGLREAGAVVDDRVEEHEYGRFGWATDPEGNRLEFWEPPK